MIQRQTGGAKAGELGLNFCVQLRAQCGLAEVAKTGRGRIVAEFPRGIDQARNLGGREGGATAQEGNMQSHPETGVRPSQSHGFRQARFVDHEARRGQDAVAMRLDDGLIDGRRPPEIVGIDNQSARRLRACHS